MGRYGVSDSAVGYADSWAMGRREDFVGAMRFNINAGLAAFRAGPDGCARTMPARISGNE